MTAKLSYGLIGTLFLLAACGGRGSSGAAQQDYEVVQEGSAAGVTSTIHGPGETIPPITSTNADPTSAFTLNPNAVPPPTQPGTLGSTLPDQPYGGAPVYRPPAPRPAPPPVEEPVTPPVTETASPDPAPTDTAPPPSAEPAEDPPPPATDTTATATPPPPPLSS